VPRPQAPLAGSDRQALGEAARVKAEMERLLDTFHFRDAQKEAMNLARTGNRYLAEAEPWKLAAGDMPRVATVLYVALQITAGLSIAFAPFLPAATRKLCGMLNMAPQGWNRLGETALLEPGHVLGKAGLLFEKIDDSVIEAQIRKLADRKNANEAAAYRAKPVRETIGIDDFARLDIRTGIVLECFKVPKADKLLQFCIDDGLNRRTILSGVAAHYRPEDLVGRQVCFVANLAPRKLRGVISEGMILYAEDAGGRLVAVMPEAPVHPGSEVK
jgi:methionyl-tRNA synthetase